MLRFLSIILIASAAAIAVQGCSSDPAANNARSMENAMPDQPSAQRPVPPLLDFVLADIDGKPMPLSQYQGKVLLLVNVASQCGHTPQYQGLQVLHETYAKKGLVLIGLPCNDFGSQEPGTELEISEFCSVNYGVSFPMTSKVSIKGDSPHPLYAALTSGEHNPADPGPVKWNFEKFLIGRDGRLAARFRSAVKPLSSEVTQAIERELEKPAP